jgi:hypothetical protein
MICPVSRLGYLALYFLSLTFILAAPALADGIADNDPAKVRAVPPEGIELPAADQAALQSGLERLNAAIAELRKKDDPQTQMLLPDVEIFARAIHEGMKYREWYTPQDVTAARHVLAEGQRRADSLLNGVAPWLLQKGLVVRGFRSRIDQTVQPYGLVIPASYVHEGKDAYRLDLWLHGRGERTTESIFINERMKNVGQIAPKDTIVLHPYGRYSNAFKFAGEVDVLEALEHAKKFYRIDDNRIAVRGFSMGGAGCWQLAVHYPDLFFAANPGAGFSETPEILKFFQQETLRPTWYEKELWQMYDCTGYAANLHNLPTVAYSGELDIQKQAADIMEEAVEEAGLRLMHIIGPETKHSIHKDSLSEMEAKLASIAEAGRDRLPSTVRFETYTMKYNRSHWVTITQLGEHWKPASVSAKLLPENNRIDIVAKNVKGIKLTIPAGMSPFLDFEPIKVTVFSKSGIGPDQELDFVQVNDTPRPATDRSWECELHLAGEAWKVGPAPEVGLVKQHNLQGPIDDAFMDSFIVVLPSGKSEHEAIQSWAASEAEHFIKEWRRQFRGDAVVKRDTEITPEDIASSNLILFGDPASNSVMKSIADKLPIQWNAKEVVVGEKKFDAAHHAPELIYPNPANPQRYVVLNSGFTYREFAYLNNARQVPKLPDWAVIDVRTPADSLWPGKVVDADFFDEQWKLKPAKTDQK